LDVSERLDGTAQDVCIFDGRLVVPAAAADGVEAQLLVEIACDGVRGAYLEEDFAHAAT
jgi:hypothetical protein